VGCGGFIHDAARSAAEGAVAGVTSTDAAAALTHAGREVVAGARDEALGPATKAQLEALVRTLGASLRQQVITLREDVLDSADLRWEIGQLREALVGAPLRADVDAMIDEAAPHLAAAVALAMEKALVPLREQADAASATWRTTALVVGGASLALLLALGVAIYELRAHRRAFAALLDSKIGDGGSIVSGGGGGSGRGRTVGFRR
jgi:hypothetical protein